MSYSTSNTETNILDRMKTSITDNIEKTEGSFIHDALAPVSKELSSTYLVLDNILSLAFPQTSSGDYLTMIAASHGVIKKLGEAAVGQVTFSGTNGAKILTDIIVESQSGLQFITTAEGTIVNNVAVVNVIATNIGSQYNMPSGTITKIPTQIQGITSVANANPIAGGADIETDSELLKRLLEKVQNPSTGGNSTDYELWAKEINGVTDAKCIPLWNGPGTVKVVCYGKNGIPLDGTIIKNVQEYIMPLLGFGKAPIGAKVTIVTSALKAINITIVNLDTADMDSTISNIKTNIQTYLVATKPGETVKLKDIEVVITNTDGVNDYSYILLNDDNRNILLDDESKPILGTIDTVQDASSSAYTTGKIIVVESFYSLENITLNHGIYSPKDGGIKC